MANALLTPTLISKQALGFWQNASILPSLFNRAYESEFGGGNGDTVTIRKQATLTASLYDRPTGVVVQDVVESSVAVTVDKLYDVSVEITQEQWDFDVADFGWQVAEPAGRALSRMAEGLIATELATHAASTTWPQVDLIEGFINARGILNAAEVPLEQRFILVSTEVASMLLMDPNFLKANEAGDNGALREARIGRFLGMDVYENVVLGANEAYVCHKDALTFVSVVPQLSRGAANGAVGSYDGLGLRTVFGYDQNKKQDLISFDSYYEIASLRGDPAYQKLDITPTV